MFVFLLDRVWSIAPHGEHAATPRISGELVLKDFWEHFEALHPTHPVVLDFQSGFQNPTEVVPVLLHGDGGRHFRKSEIMVVQFQSLIGSGTRKSPKVGEKRKLDEAGDICAADVNMLGHSFATRFLIGTMLKQFYKDSVEPLLQFFKHISSFFAELYTTGISFRGVQLKFALLGCKGDLPFLSKVAGMERNFLRTRKKKTKNAAKDLAGICWLCSAGKDCGGHKILFEDFSREAEWMSTQGIANERPWKTEPSILADVVHDRLQQPSFFKLDVFHILQAGILKDFTASCLTMVLPFMGQGSQDRNLEELNCVLARFLKQSRLVLHCRQLSLALLGADSLKKAPVGGWSKGHDSVVMMLFIPFLLEAISLDVETAKPWTYVYAGTCAMNRCMAILHREPVWMDPSRAMEAGQNGYCFLQAYSKLARYALDAEGRLLFNLVPKLHYWHHVVEVLVSTSTSGHRPLNPLTHSTFQCEDFIGRISRISRRVKPTHVHRNVLRRYAAALSDKLGFLE